MIPQELEDLTFQHLPPTFFRSVLRTVFQAYDVAWSECRKQFTPRQFDNMVGYFIRGKLEDGLQAVSDRFPATTAVNQRAPRSKWNRTEIHCGPILLVENAVETPCGMLTGADFRRTLAASNQGSLFEDTTRKDDDPLYVALVHSRSIWRDATEHQKWGHLPGSAFLAFPARDLDCYVHDIDLFNRFPDVVESATPKEWDTEALVRYLDRARKPLAA